MAVKMATSLMAVMLNTLPAAACTACFGNPESAQTQGMNAAILTLLGVTGGVALVVAGVVLHLVTTQKHSEI